MKQILHSLKTGVTEVAEVPSPSVRSGHLLICSTKTLISTGTERMLVEFGKAGLLKKARQQPDKVRMVLDKLKTDGLMPTIETVFNKLDQPLPLGYCNVGLVTKIGPNVSGFSVGDRVASTGRHAEVVSVPTNLVARIPDIVSDDAASFTVIAAISLQGIRLVQPTLGEAVVVTGLGLVGLMTVQLLRAQGCRVLGIDYDAAKLALAKQFGAEVVNLSLGEDPLVVAHHFSRGRGVDAVIITASTTSSEPMHQAALMSRKRGRIVLVGVTGLELSRADFFEKELTFQVSCSYGPGRHDINYEDNGQDYPFAYVRWTEQRNFEAVLDMMASGALDVRLLISHEFKIAEAKKAYNLIVEKTPSLGVLLTYPEQEFTEAARTVAFHRLEGCGVMAAHHAKNKTPKVSFIGAGNYATAVLIPAFKAAGVGLRSVASSAGVSGVHAGRKYGFEETTTDIDRLIEDAATDAVVIATRHDSHAYFVLKALAAGKHVFVEKPMCLTLDALSELEAAYSKSTLLMVGFNRRFAPQVQKIKSLLQGVSGPKAMVITVNAGGVPADHWAQNFKIGGGRVIGEACHFIDLLRFLAGVPIISYQLVSMDAVTSDTVTLQLSFADGSIGTVHYFANGPKNFPKERVEVFASGGVLQLDNYRKLRGFGWPGFKKMNLWRQNKGQKACAKAFVDALMQGVAPPIPVQELFEVSRISIALANQ